MGKDFDFNVNLDSYIDAVIKAFLGSTKSKIQKMSSIQMMIFLVQVSSLLDNNVHLIHVSQLSGHKNIGSLKTYHSASALHQESISDIISKHQQNREISTAIPISNSLQPAVTICTVWKENHQTLSSLIQCFLV